MALIAVLQQVLGGDSTPICRTAMQQQMLALRHRRQFVGIPGRERQQDGALDMAGVVFVLLAHIDHHGLALFDPLEGGIDIDHGHLIAHFGESLLSYTSGQDETGSALWQALAGYSFQVLQIGGIQCSRSPNPLCAGLWRQRCSVLAPCPPPLPSRPRKPPARPSPARPIRGRKSATRARGRSPCAAIISTTPPSAAP